MGVSLDGEFNKSVPVLDVFVGDELREIVPRNLVAALSEEGGSGVVDPLDVSIIREGQVGRRGKFVETDIAAA